MVKGKKIFLCFFVIITLNIHAQETRNYVLTQDLVYTTHTPIMNPDGTAFTGNFYGNGHTIIIRGFAPDVTNNFGLFGEVSTGAVIRDLTVRYETVTGGAVTISPASGGRFGGIAATVSGGARFENVLVKGAVVVSGSGEVTVGGMVGRITSTATTPKATITNAYGGLNLTVNRYGYIGGVAGSVCTPTSNANGATTVGAAADLIGITVVGDITVGSTSRVNGRLFLGGLAGIVAGTSSSFAVFDDVEYKNGTITINKGTDFDYIGGAIGYISGNTDIKNCPALSVSFTIDKDTSSASTVYFEVGGFIGRVENTGNTIRNCYSENPLILTINGNISIMRIGGFVGYLGSDIAYCYAKEDISISASSAVLVGGFVGQDVSGSNTKFCYAMGNVSIIRNSETDQNIIAGGFSGTSRGSIAHSYALGNVYIDTRTNNLYAGGFSGRQTSGDIENCFALGNVIANRSTSGDAIYTGGIVGEQNATVSNCVVAVLPSNVNTGMSITSTGPTTNRHIGRVSGSLGGTRSNNYAWNGIQLFSDPAYGIGNPAPDTSITTVTRVHDGKDGADVSSGVLRNGNFWRGTPPAVLTSGVYTSGGMGFTGTVNTTINGITANYPAWDFLSIEGRGYPRIRHPNGVGVLGGQ